MKELLVVAAAGEAALGVVLLVHPSIVVRMLFNAEIAGAGVVMGRIAGIALIALGVACWPERETGGSAMPLFGMITYSVLAALFLAYQGLFGEWDGSLLWPAVALHVVLTFLLAREWQKKQRA